MDFNQLNCFISVAQTLNFSEAARRNYVSQSTVSRYIGELEKEFGVQLFTRSHRDVIITNEGKILLPYAIDIVNTLSKAKTVIKQMRDGSTGKLTIGCDVTSKADYRLRRHFNELSVKMPCGFLGKIPGDRGGAEAARRRRQKSGDNRRRI